MKCIGLVLVLAACGGTHPAHPSTDSSEIHTALAEDDAPPPSYDQAAIGKALSGERAAEAHLEREAAEAEAAGDLDKSIVARADLGVRRRFLATLELCEAKRQMCPPRLDEPAGPFDGEADPKLDVPLRFDLASWRKVAGELHDRACGCRTIACVDSMDVTLARLETRPVEDVQQDGLALDEVTHARDCLFRLRGKKRVPRVLAEE